MDYKYLYESSGYPTLKTNSYLFICIISLIIGILLISKMRTLEFINNTSSILQKIIKIVRNIFLITSLGSFLFYIYIYVVYYLPEYYKWFDSLEPHLKAAIITKAVINDLRMT